VGEKNKLRSDSRTECDDTQAQLKADEIFFENTKVCCQDVAFVWAGRCRRRTAELHGIITAIEVLSHDEAKQIFKRATTTLVQLQASHRSILSSGFRHAQMRQQIFAQLSKLASKRGTAALGRVAVAAQSGSTFRKVITMINNMIGHLRKEEAHDIAHRDRCQNAQQKKQQCHGGCEGFAGTGQIADFSAY